jgi:aminoglycoside phosphotransferase (APT) family kinase protein
VPEARLTEWSLRIAAHAKAVLDLSSAEVLNLRPLASVGNARVPWQFELIEHTDATTRTTHAVMLVQPVAGQIEADLDTEYTAMSALHAAGLAVPRPLWCDTTGEVLGLPSLVTERVEGSAEHTLLHRTDEAARAIIVDLAAVLAGIHALDPARLKGWERPQPTAAHAQLTYWRDAFLRHRLEPLPAMVYAYDWLAHQAPDDDRITLVHVDFRVGNFLAIERQVSAVLDWELAHLGDPCEDIAWMYRSMWSPNALCSLDQFIDTYERVADVAVDRRRIEFYRLFGEIKHATISLTAAHAFITGTTSNLKLADRGSTVVTFLQEFLTGVDRFEERHS